MIRSCLGEALLMNTHNISFSFGGKNALFCYEVFFVYCRGISDLPWDFPINYLSHSQALVS